jgi:hypothetical protein
VFAVAVDSAKGGHVRKASDGLEDALYCSTPVEDGAKDVITGPMLGPGIHLVAILLIGKHDGKELGF